MSLSKKVVLDKKERFTINIFTTGRYILTIKGEYVCEDPQTNPRSECHGWSSAPLYEFSSKLLGVKVGFDDEIVIKPYLSDLTFAKGNTPTRFGDVFVSWKKGEGELIIEIESPEGVEKKLILPDGEVKTFKDAKFQLAVV